MSIKDGPGEGTWSVFAQKVVEERDAAREEVARLRAERDDAIEQARRLDELYEAACADIGDLQGKMDRLRAENERLRRVAETLVAGARDPATYDGIARAIVEARKVFDDGDIPLADYCARALHGGK